MNTGMVSHLGPDASEQYMCEAVAMAYRRNWTEKLSDIGQTVLNLMLAGFCLLFAAGCTNHGELSSLKSILRTSGEKQDQTLTSIESTRQEIVSKSDTIIDTMAENTTALAAIKSQIDTLKASQAESETGNRIGGDLQSESTAPNDNANDSHLATMVVAESGAVQLFVTSSESCAPCQKLWKDVEAGKFAGFDVRKSDDFEGLMSYPAIRFRSDASPTGWAVRYGYDATQLQWLRTNLLRETHGVMSGGEPVTGSFFPVQRSNSFVSARSTVRPFSRWPRLFWGARTVSR